MRKNFLKCELGQGLVEFAIVSIAFFMISFAIIDVGYVGFHYVMYEYALEEAFWKTFPYYKTEYVSTLKKYYLDNYSYPFFGNFMKFGMIFDDEKCIMYYGNNDPYIYKEVIKIKHEDGSESKEERFYLHLDIKSWYELEPLTPFGKLIFGENLKIKKDINRIRLLEAKNS